MRRLRYTVLLACSTLMLLATPMTAFADQEADISSFLSSNLQYCDAEVVANAWGTSIDNAKAALGYKVSSGNTALLREVLDEARGRAFQEQKTCYYYQNEEWGYDDAEALSAAWGISVGEAKAAISYKLSVGTQDWLRQEIQMAESGEGDESGVHADAMASDIDAFFGSKYQYCDAKSLSVAWSTTVEDAKATIGYKVRVGYTDQLPPMLSTAREDAHKKGVHCFVEMAGLSNDDIGVLATAWDMSEKEARAFADDKIAFGGGDIIDGLLR